MEQILRAAPDKAVYVQTPTFHHKKTSKLDEQGHAGHSWRSKDVFISNTLLWTPSHGRARKDHRLDPLYNSSVPIQDVVWRRTGSDGRWRRMVIGIRKIRAGGSTWWWWWWWCLCVCVCLCVRRYWCLCVCIANLLGCPRGVMVKVMDCGIVVSEFVLQSRYYVHFRANTLGKRMDPLILPAKGWIVPLLFF